MKTTSVLTIPSGAVAGKAHALWRYLDRLASAWEYAGDKDLAILDRLLDELESELSRAEEDSLPPDAEVVGAGARHAIGRARTTTADRRMRNLEAARHAVEAMLVRLPPSV